MAKPDLSESAWWRAKREAIRAYRSATFALSMTVLSLLTAALAGLNTPDNADTRTELLMPLAFGLAALVVGCLLVLAFEVAAAPLRQRNELRRTWVSLDPLDPDLELKDLRRRGRDMLAELGTPNFSLDGDAAETWTLEVVEFLGTHGDREQAELFLDVSDGKRGPVPALESRLAALDGIVESREKLP
ncbi:MAG: hypothetical protein WA687_13240 [Solirubrobacterales bacterium]